MTNTTIAPQVKVAARPERSRRANPITSKDRYIIARVLHITHGSTIEPSEVISIRVSGDSAIVITKRGLYSVGRDYFRTLVLQLKQEDALSEIKPVTQKDRNLIARVLHITHNSTIEPSEIISITVSGDSAIAITRRGLYSVGKAYFKALVSQLKQEG